MLVGLSAPLREGATFPLTLVFERAGEITVEVAVERPRPASAAADAHGSHGGPAGGGHDGAGHGAPAR
jgi:copper(I)-binding protein